MICKMTIYSTVRENQSKQSPLWAQARGSLNWNIVWTGHLESKSGLSDLKDAKFCRLPVHRIDVDTAFLLSTGEPKAKVGRSISPMRWVQLRWIMKSYELAISYSMDSVRAMPMTVVLLFFGIFRSCPHRWPDLIFPMGRIIWPSILGKFSCNVFFNQKINKKLFEFLLRTQLPIDIS